MTVVRAWCLAKAICCCLRDRRFVMAVAYRRPNRLRALTDQSDALRIERYARSGKEPREDLSCQLDQRARSRNRLHSVVFVAVSRRYSSFPEEQRNAVWSAVQTWRRPSC